MRRGELWWAVLPPPSGPRAVLLLSRDSAYAVRTLVTIAPVTTRIRGIPTEVGLGIVDGLDRQSVVNLDLISTVPKNSLRHRIAPLRQERLAAVETAIHFALGISR